MKPAPIVNQLSKYLHTVPELKIEAFQVLLPQNMGEVHSIFVDVEINY